MKNLSNEELINECSKYYSNYSRGIALEYSELKFIYCKHELLRRLEHGDRAIKACKEIAAMELEEAK